MQTVYRAKTPEDAESARELLAAADISSHVADRHLTVVGGTGNANFICVLVDDRMLDRARRVIQKWRAE